MGYASNSSESLLTQLQRYVPEQLVQKIRAIGQVEGERRQVTVLFADISGFTALSERIDMEELASLVSDCLKELVRAVYQYEGMVDKFVGDCIMAVFGAPVAHEDDAERAVRAALAMLENMQSFNQRWIKKLGQSLELHLGLNTGEVIAGNVGSDLRMNYTVMGDTVNIASRLQDEARAGQILVSQSTYRLTRGAFTFQEMDLIQVKGKRDSLRVYELLRAKVQPGKARGVEGLISILVGRDPEYQVLVNCLERLKQGRGQVVMILGEAGIGKSRLLSEIRQREGQGLTWLEGRSFAFSRTMSYAPFLDLLRRFSGISDEDSEAEARASLQARLSEVFPDETDVYPVLAQLLSMRLDTKEAATVEAMAGEAYRSRLFEILEEFILRLAKQNPVVVVLDDLHWADQSSIELVSHLVSVSARASVVFVVLSRPKQEWSESWKKLVSALKGLGDRCTEISLAPLSEDSSLDLVEALLGGSALSEQFCRAIIDKAEGNPFFVEEVLQSFIERGVLARKGREWTVTELVETIQVPDTLQGVLLSRIDRLSEETRRVIELAAVIGRVFLLRVLDHIAPGEAELETQMRFLVDADLVRERAQDPEIEYIFKHALTQEVAYQILLIRTRKHIHKKVGEVIEALFAERIEEFSGILAYHYSCGEAWEKAFEYSMRAANTAVDVYAYPEARQHYRQALEMLKHLPDDGIHRRNYVDLSVRLVNVSLQAESPEKNLELLRKAEATAQSLGELTLLARVQLWIGRVHYLAGRLPEAIGYFQKVLAVAPQLQDPILLALPGAVIGRVLFIQGRFMKARQLLEQAAPLLKAAKNYHELLFVYIYRGATVACLGDYSAGLVDLTGALKMTQASHDKNAEIMAHTGMALVHLVAGKYDEGIESARKALAIADCSGDSMFRYSSNSFIAWGLTGLGDHEGAMRHWAAAHEAAKPLGDRLLLGEWLAAIEAETLLESDVVSALRKGEETLAMAKAAGSMIAEGLAERIIGRALAASPAPRCDEADAHLSKSVSLLEGIGAKFDLARTALAQGQARLALGDKHGAAEPLKRVVVLSSECGLQREEAAARVLLAEIRTT